MTGFLPVLVSLVQEEAHGGGGLGPFAVEPGLIIWTWVVFIALLVVLGKFAWPAILKATEERERKIQHQLAEAERMNTEAQAALEEHRRLLAGAKDQAQALMAEARQVAQQERETLLARTREEQDGLLERARREITAERERAVVELRREAVELSLAAASRLIEQKLDDEGNRRLVMDYLGSLEQRH